MSQTGFVIDKTPIKDMSNEDLKKASAQFTLDLQAVGNQLNAMVQQLQVSTAMLNVVNYEIDRRANSIAIALTIPH